MDLRLWSPRSMGYIPPCMYFPRQFTHSGQVCPSCANKHTFRIAISNRIHSRHGPQMTIQAQDSSSPATLAIPSNPRHQDLHPTQTQHQQRNQPQQSVDKIQPLDFTTLHALTAEIFTQSTPSRIELIFQASPHKLYIALRTQTSRKWLTVCWHPEFAYMAIQDTAPIQKSEKEDMNYTLSATLRSLIGGSVLVNASIAAPYERVARLDFAQRPGDVPEYSMFLEVFGGGRSNMVLVDGRNEIRACGRQVSGKKNVRGVMVGWLYDVVPPASTAYPRVGESMEEWKKYLLRVSSGVGVSKALVRCYSGVSPALANALLYIAQIPPATLIECMTDKEWSALYDEWQCWIAGVSDSSSTIPVTCISIDKSKHQDQGFSYAVLYGGSDRAIHSSPGIQTFPCASELVAWYYSTFEIREEFGRLYRSIQSRVEAIEKKVRARYETFLARLDEARNLDDMREKADKILSFAHAWKPGDLSIVYKHDSNEENDEKIEIPAGCTDVIEEAMKLHNESGKLKRAMEKLQPLVQQTKLDLEYIEQIKWSVMSLKPTSKDQLMALREIQDEVLERLNSRVPGGVVHSAQSGGTSKNDSALSTPPKKISTKNAANKKGGGNANDKKKAANPTIDLSQFVQVPIPASNPLKVVLVGRNNRQNDILSFKVAKDSDLWFHTVGQPGAHCILRLNSGESASEEEIQFAADVAAFYSRARDSTQVSVAYCRPKHLRRAGVPGMVTFEKETVVFGRPGRVDQAGK